MKQQYKETNKCLQWWISLSAEKQSELANKKNVPVFGLSVREIIELYQEQPKPQITFDYDPRTGLVEATQHEGDDDNERSIFLVIEDIDDLNEFVQNLDRKNIAHREDFQ